MRTRGKHSRKPQATTRNGLTTARDSLVTARTNTTTTHEGLATTSGGLTTARMNLVQASLGVGLGCALVAASLAPAGLAYGATPSAKDEVVYAKADPSGSTQGIFVVNVFQGTGDKVSDPGSYQQVTNLSTTQQLVQDGGKVVFNTQANQAFFYQGDLDASTQLPWDIDVTYRLDGKKITAQEASGASGDLTVTLSIVPSSSSDLAAYCDSYLVQAQGTFDPNSFQVASSDATMAHSGSDTVATCLVLPGESGTFTIKGTANGFSYDGWQISAVPLSMAIDLADQDTSQLSAKTGELESATGQLADGGKELKEGATALDDGATALELGAALSQLGGAAISSGADELSNGVSAMSDGVKEATSNLDKISQNSAGLMAGFQQLSEGISNVKSGADQLLAGSDQYQQTLDTSKAQVATGAAGYNDALAAFQAAMTAYQLEPSQDNLAVLNQATSLVLECAQAAGAYSALDSASIGYSRIAAGITQLDAGAVTLDAGATSFQQSLGSYTGNVDELNSAASSLNDAADSLTEGASSLAEGANSMNDVLELMTDGASTLSEGTASMATATETLSSGLDTLASSVQGMDQQVLSAMQEAIDQKLGADFQPRSFAVPSNTKVDQVQFVYVVEGVKAPEAEAEPVETPDENKGFLEKLLSLFGM